MNIIIILIISYFGFSFTSKLSPADMEICSGRARPENLHQERFRDPAYSMLCLETAFKFDNQVLAAGLLDNLMHVSLKDTILYMLKLCQCGNMAVAQFVYDKVGRAMDMHMVVKYIIKQANFKALEFLLSQNIVKGDLYKILKGLVDKEQWDLLSALIENPNTDLSSSSVASLLYETNLVHIWPAILKNKTFKILGNRYTVACRAISQGNIELIKALQSLPDFNPSFGFNRLILSALSEGHENIAITLLTDNRCIIGRHALLLGKKALKKGALDFVRALISKGIADPRHLGDITLLIVRQDQGDLLSWLLEKTNFDPAARKSSILFKACKFGSANCFQVLLKDGRANPTLKVGGECVITMAASLGHSEILQMLLQDSRVDPTVFNNEAVMLSNTNHHHKCTTLLLEDPRVLDSIDLRRVNFLCSGKTSAREKNLLWRWLLKNDNCNGILTTFETNPATNMSMADFDTVRAHFTGLGAFSVVKLVQRKIYARRLIHSIFDENLFDRAAIDIYQNIEDGILEDKDDESDS